MRMSMTRKDFQIIAMYIHNALDNDTDIMEGLLRSFEVINPAFSRETFIKEAIPAKLINGARCISKVTLHGRQGKGELGRVLGEDGEFLLVEFDKKMPGLHDGGGKGGLYGRDGHCWWVFPKDIEYV